MKWSIFASLKSNPLSEMSRFDVDDVRDVGARGGELEADGWDIENGYVTPSDFDEDEDEQGDEQAPAPKRSGYLR